MIMTNQSLSQLITDAERSARIVVVDDDLSNVNVLIRTLQRAGFNNVHGVWETENVMESILAFQPDVVLLDLHMPGVDGLEVLMDLKAVQGRRNYLPVLVLTGDGSRE